MSASASVSPDGERSALRSAALCSAADELELHGGGYRLGSQQPQQQEPAASRAAGRECCQLAGAVLWNTQELGLAATLCSHPPHPLTCRPAPHLSPPPALPQNEADAFRNIQLTVEDVQGRNCLTQVGGR